MFALFLGSSLFLFSLQIFGAEYLCVDTDHANLRSGPASSHPVVSKMNKYTPVELLEKKDSWFKIKSKNETGWLHSSLVMSEGTCKQATTTTRTHTKPSPYSPGHPHKEKVFLGEGLLILDNQIGVEKVKDKYGNIFWINSDHLWPNTESKIEL